MLTIAVWGPRQALAQHAYFVTNVVLAGVSADGGQAVGEELTRTTATDSQSFVAALHHLRHRATPREARPPQASGADRLTHWAISGTLAAVTLLAARRLTASPADHLVYFGCACAVMVVASPVSHMHYYAFVLPLVSGLWLRAVAGRPGRVFPDRRTACVLAAWGAATALPLLPGEPFHTFRETGLGTAATVLLWGFGLSAVGTAGRAAAPAPPPLAPRRLVCG